VTLNLNLKHVQYDLTSLLLGSPVHMTDQTQFRTSLKMHYTTFYSEAYILEDIREFI